MCHTPDFLLLAKQAFQAAQIIADLVHIDLGLDEIDQCFYLIIGHINTYQLLHCEDGIFLKFRGNVFIVLDLLDDLFCFCFQLCF